jgi:hypothetical protein
LVLTIGKLLLSLFAVSPQSGWAALTNTGSVHNATIKEVGQATVISSVSTRELLDANWWLAIDRSILEQGQTDKPPEQAKHTQDPCWMITIRSDGSS